MAGALYSMEYCMWFVWNRFVSSNGYLYGWCDVPKQYKTKRAAHMAVRDLTKQSEEVLAKIRPLRVVRCEYLALPDGMTPRRDMVIRWIDTRKTSHVSALAA
jgi:hypothetical protein